MLPARVDELEKVRLILELMRSDRSAAQLRQLLTEEETEQQGLRRQIDDRLGPLRATTERLKAEVERAEQRLERLTFVDRSLSDDELDREEERHRADEAAWWAEWRHRKSNQKDLHGEVVDRKSDDDIAIRQIYRALARLIHPDLADDSRDRARRETVMRLANAARENRDVEQLRRLLAIWAGETEQPYPYSVDVVRARVAQRRLEVSELKRQLAILRRTPIGLLLRRGENELRQYFRLEEVRLRRELATLRLRRRRVLRQLDVRRQELSIQARD